MAKEEAARPKVDVSEKPLSSEFPTALNASCNQVWSGNIARLRIYDQPASTGKKVFAYKAPGTNADYVGYSDDPNMIHALFLARDNGRGLQGFTNASCKIEWIDY